MKSSLLFIFSLLSRCVFSQPSAHDDEILQIKGKWTKRNEINEHNDSLSSASQSALEIKKLAFIADLLKQACPEPAGIEAAWHPSINGRPMFRGAPASYSLTSLYKSYYFNDNLNKILVGDETGTWIYADINNLRRFLVDQGSWIVDGQPTEFFSLPESDGEWKGWLRYKSEHWEANTTMGRYTDKAVLITRAGKLPYTPITQKQYLLALLQRWNNQKKKAINDPLLWEAAQRKHIEAIRNEKNLSAEMREKIISGLQKQLEQEQQARGPSVQKLNKHYDDKIKIIDQYLATHSEQEMQEAAAVAITNDEDFPGKFGPVGKQAVQNLVQINPSYFDTRLPRYTPQFIVLYWRCDKQTAASEFIKRFETNVPVERMQAMIDK